MTQTIGGSAIHWSGRFLISFIFGLVIIHLFSFIFSIIGPSFLLIQTLLCLTHHSLGLTHSLIHFLLIAYFYSFAY